MPEVTSRAERAAAEADDEEEQTGRFKRITPKVLKQLKKEQDLYSTPSLNDKLYLHYHGFLKIEGLDEWTGLRALWLEGNGFHKLEGFDKLSELRCLYAHQNCLKTIENLEHCPQLATLQLNNNMIRSISNLSCLGSLSTLQLANNQLTTCDDLRHLLECPTITVLDLQNNRLEDASILDVFEAMPVLAVLQLMGNPVVPKITQYRRNVVSRCKALTYLDDRPIFEEERKAVEAWAVGGLEAEREERKRQREEKDLAHRRNLDHMISMMKKEKVTRSVDGFYQPVADDEDEDESDAERAKQYPNQAAAAAAAKREAEEKLSERDMYDRALGALERKKRELQRQKAQREAAEATAAEAASGAAADEEEDGDDEPPPPPLVGAGTDGAAAFDQSFIPAATFEGTREGYVYKRGGKGLGYYRDGATEPVAQARPAKDDEELVVKEADEGEDLDDLD
jgi:hypothetical protein